ncbi:MAG: TetR family transcriptional regulator [Chitinivibrionales bacterium]|nr:TetR family transcriptional regulator [Chitinivibrionales bacterium]
MDPKVNRRQTILDAKKGLILDAARRVFAERGYHETSIEHIAREAGFSKPSLYNYYKDKEDIFLQLSLREIDILLSKMNANCDDSFSSMKNLEGMIRAVFDTFGEHFYFMLTLSHFPLVVLAHHENSQELHRQFASRLMRIVGKLTSVIARGREKGEINTTVNDENCARYITGMIKSVFVHWRMNEKMGDAEQEIAHIMTFISQGVLFYESR